MQNFPWETMLFLLGLPALIALIWIEAFPGGDREIAGGVSVMGGMFAFAIKAAKN